jgi:putative spermidine/putrescine transport system permease protein
MAIARNNPWLLVLPLVLLLCAFFILPIGRILWISVSDPSLGVGNYARLGSNEALQRVLLTTFRIASITTVVAVLLGYLVAYVMTHAGPVHRLWIMSFVLIPFWVSVLVRTFSWLVLLRKEGVLNSSLLAAGLVSSPVEWVYNELGVLIGMVHYMIPFAVLPIYSSLSGMDQRLANASRSLGAGPLRTFFSVTLPLSAPGIVASAIVVFVFSLGFFVTPAVLGGGKAVMIAEYVNVQILKTVRWGIGTMMASLLLLAVFFLLLLLSRFVNVPRLFGAK